MIRRIDWTITALIAGLEVKAAQDRLEAPTPRRVVTIRNGVDGEVEL
jgi:hypothetical protein